MSFKPFQFDTNVGPSSDEISVGAVTAVFNAIQYEGLYDKIYTLTPWAYQSGGREYGQKDQALPTIALSYRDTASTLLSALKERIKLLEPNQELGLISLITVNTGLGISPVHIPMLDYEPYLSDTPKSGPGWTVLNSGNSYHGYGPVLVSWEKYAEYIYDQMIGKQPIDTSWAGFTLKRGFGVLRVSARTKPLPTLVARPPDAVLVPEEVLF
jgi:hypothetical protein